ncbi:CDP-alcohol phosphatidyltransferase family protein [Chloroflexota bacterium]
MIRLSTTRKSIAYYLTQPVVYLLAKTNIAPNTVSWFGFLITVGATALIITKHLFAAGFVVLVAGFFDILDGALARSTNRTTQFGSILDSTLDRLAEAVLLLGILVLYAREQSAVGIVIVGLALLGSLLVSYIRAKAEALGLECEVGLFTRAERVIVLALGLLLNQLANALVIALIVITIFSFVTAGHRLFYVWRQTKNPSSF